MLLQTWWFIHNEFEWWLRKINWQNVTPFTDESPCSSSALPCSAVCRNTRDDITGVRICRVAFACYRRCGTDRHVLNSSRCVPPRCNSTLPKNFARSRDPTRVRKTGYHVIAASGWKNIPTISFWLSSFCRVTKKLVINIHLYIISNY